MQRIPKDAKIRKNISRLTHYIEESNTGKGFIKEQSFSPCGRFLASPFGYGVRLLGFSERGSDLADCPPSQPQLLHELGTKLGHNDVRSIIIYCPLIQFCVGRPVYCIFPPSLAAGHRMLKWQNFVAPASTIDTRFFGLKFDLCLQLCDSCSRETWSR